MTAKVSVTIRSDADRARVAKWARDTGVGTVVEFKKPTRSVEQNALLWSCLQDISRQVEWYGQYLSSEDWKDVLTASLRRARVVPGIDKGTFVPLGMRTSQMTIGEMTDLLDLIFAFGSERGVQFTDPGASLPASGGAASPSTHAAGPSSARSRDMERA